MDSQAPPPLLHLSLGGLKSEISETFGISETCNCESKIDHISLP